MRILANENVYEPMIEYLRGEGHDVVSCRDSELSGASDDEVYRRAVEDGLIVVTMDKDFLRMRRFPPQDCGGIVVAKIYRRTVDETTSIFRERFGELSEESIRGKLVIVTSEGIRVRTPES